MIMQCSDNIQKPLWDASVGTKLAHSEEARIRLMELQARFENQTVDIGKAAYRTFTERRDVLEVTSGAKLLRLMMPPAQAAVRQLQASSEENLAHKGQRHKWVWHLMALDAAKLALIAVAGVLRGVMDGYAGLRTAGVREVSESIAKAVADEIEFARWEAEQLAEAKEAKLGHEIGGKLLMNLKYRYPNIDRKVWAKWRRKIELVREEPLERAAAISFGSALINCVVSENAKYVTINEIRTLNLKSELRVTATDLMMNLVKDITAIAEVAHPPLRPMLCPPNPWVYEGNKVSGGYIIHREKLIRTSGSEHSTKLEKPVSQVDLNALNAVQSVPWQINKRVYDVAEQAMALKLPLPSLPELDNIVIPNPLSAEVWAGLDLKGRQEHSKARRDAYDKRASVLGVAITVRDRMDVAKTLYGFPAIYFPHSRDFRGRMYPIPSRGPHPQADDLGKSLIQFARGKPLGETGLYWLCVHAANCAGQNKLTFDERVAWTWGHYAEIIDAAQQPLLCGLKFWTVADDPWQLLAVCFELAEAMNRDDMGVGFVSHLAVPLDGSCNGLQHLSAMGLDAVGAKATNLTDSPIRQDIYEDVAVIVRQIVETDAAAGKAEALAWYGRVNRKVCKRSVMTTPYGVTARGICRQLVNDDLCPTWKGQTGKERAGLATYLGDCLGTALSQVIKASKGIMAWCQTTATRLAEANLPLDWMTPSGSMVRQAYYERTEKRIATLSGTLVVYEEQLDGTIMKKKAALAASPNIVHSFDAAHLALTVNGAVAEGITDFAMIHDSYGTHACDTMAFAYILRREFVAIYKSDWLSKIRDYILSYAEHVELPEVPAREMFDIDQVMQAPFFFS